MVDEAPDKRPVFVYLSDILAETDFLRSASAGLTFEQYLQSGEKRRAIERSLEIISEATRRIPETDRALHPEVPWRRVQDLGNVIRHAYFGPRKNAFGLLFKRSSISWNWQSASFNPSPDRVEHDHSAACRSTV